MGQLGDLLFDSFNHGWMRVANADAQVHAQKIDKLIALFIPNILHLAFFKDQRFLIGREGSLRGGVIFIALGDDFVRIPSDGGGGFIVYCFVHGSSLRVTRLRAASIGRLMKWVGQMVSWNKGQMGSI